jgi:hypothetical protein
LDRGFCSALRSIRKPSSGGLAELIKYPYKQTGFCRHGQAVVCENASTQIDKREASYITTIVTRLNSSPPLQKILKQFASAPTSAAQRFRSSFFISAR